MKKIILSILSLSVLFSVNAASAFDWKAHSGKTITMKILIMKWVELLKIL